jgi:hypothetical protein
MAPGWSISGEEIASARPISHTVGQPAPHVAPPDLIGRTVAGRYRLTGFLGRGGFGAVYSGVDTETGGEVAVKVFERAEGLAPRARREARTAQKLEHPNVHRVLGVCEDEEHAYVVSELVVGERFDRSDLNELQAVLAVAAVCDALAHAHARGVIHRDVKPSNILVSTDGEIRLTDFGIARDEDAGDQTLDARVLGTLSYMAPEQAAGEGASGATDVWAAALTLYEALAGGNPYRATSLADLVERLESGAPALDGVRPDLPPALTRAVAAALQRDPRRRPTAAAFRDRLLGALRDDEPEPSGEAADDAPGAAPPPRRRRAPRRIPSRGAHRAPRAVAERSRGAPVRLGRAALAAAAMAWILTTFPVYPAAWTPIAAGVVALVAWRTPLGALAALVALAVPAFWNYAQAAGLGFAAGAALWIWTSRGAGLRTLAPLAAGALTAVGVGPAYVLLAATAPTARRRAAEAAAGAVAGAVAASLGTPAATRALAGAENPLALVGVAVRAPAIPATVTAAVAFALLLPLAWRADEPRRVRALAAWGTAFAAAAAMLAQLPGLAPASLATAAVAVTLAAILPIAWALAAPRLRVGR